MSMNRPSISLQRLFELSRHGLKLDLSLMQKLDALLLSPHRKYPIVHVGGTNGKGSVTLKVGKSLELAGAKVGYYSSPHIASCRERIQINGEPISFEKLEKLLQRLFDLVDSRGLQPTFFELMTAAAFEYFACQKVDVAVIEVGMGGRFDATNIVEPLLSIIVSVSSDHTRYLGSTLEEIAREKAGIIKAHSKVVVGSNAMMSIFRQRAVELQCELIEVNNESEDFEMQNRQVARLALEHLPFSYDVRGLEYSPPCRFEYFEYQDREVILDVGHNPAAFCALQRKLKARFKDKSWVFVLAMSEDKEIESSIEVLKKEGVHFILTQSQSKRAVSAAHLKSYFPPTASVIVENDVTKAFKRALIKARHRAVVVVCGTFYIMAEIRKLLGLKEEADPVISMY